MSISSVGAVGAPSALSATAPKAPVKHSPAPAPVTPVAKDADGDHDGTVGTNINVKA